MPERLCPKCQKNALEKYRRYCDQCRDGQAVPGGSQPNSGHAALPPAIRLQVVPALQTVASRPVRLSCGCLQESTTLWQEQDTTCAKHGAVWVTKIGA